MGKRIIHKPVVKAYVVFKEDMHDEQGFLVWKKGEKYKVLLTHDEVVEHTKGVITDLIMVDSEPPMDINDQQQLGLEIALEGELYDYYEIEDEDNN